MVLGWICYHHDRFLLHRSLHRKMIPAIIMDAITLFLKGASAAIAVYVSMLKKRDKFPPERTNASAPSIKHNVPCPKRSIMRKSVCDWVGMHSFNGFLK